MRRLPDNNYFFFFVIAIAFFFSSCPLQIWTSKTSNKDISKTIIASSLRFGQLKEAVNSLVNRMVNKLMFEGIVFHKHNFQFINLLAILRKVSSVSAVKNKST